ncbi:MAG: hypothetical protein A3F18_02840 [Legionellales bacterium RIFCSPHIGHO2_12_FULL_37_14]|nr:MAG: hypothetical protein A3F18_02840 [Legionellales bacterium RIFCSPHIGHO2_12_FULL_37_14]
MSKSDLGGDRLPSSFRDPNGYVFYNQTTKTTQRIILPSYYDQYASLMENGLYNHLADNGYLVRHELLHQTVNKMIIEPQQIPLITYSYEWSFELLKDAALLTLLIAKKALAYGMCLKDATSYNVQLYQGRPIFIDTLSFDFYQEGSPWAAYGQFCRHFLAPLLFMKYKTMMAAKLLVNYMDGFPMDFISSVLPLRTHFSPFIKMNVHLHAKKLKQSNTNQEMRSIPMLSKRKLQYMLDYMVFFVNSLSYKKNKTEWSHYYHHTNYSPAAFDTKTQVISQWVDRIGAKTLWDVGSNNGYFSRAISSHVTRVIATDIDATAIDEQYKMNKEKKISHVTPLIVDITNPSPAIGFDNKERPSFTERLLHQNIDCVLALALIHHLCLSNNCTFAMILSYFKQISPFLIIEFVPPEDSWAEVLLARKRESRSLFNFYHKANFELACQEYFIILSKQAIPGSTRTLYLLKAFE